MKVQAIDRKHISSCTECARACRGNCVFGGLRERLDFDRAFQKALWLHAERGGEQLLERAGTIEKMLDGLAEMHQRAIKGLSA